MCQTCPCAKPNPKQSEIFVASIQNEFGTTPFAAHTMQTLWRQIAGYAFEWKDDVADDDQPLLLELLRAHDFEGAARLYFESNLKGENLDIASFPTSRFDNPEHAGLDAFLATGTASEDAR